MATQGDGREGGAPRSNRGEDSVVFSLDRLRAMAEREAATSGPSRVPANFGGAANPGSSHVPANFGGAALNALVTRTAAEPIVLAGPLVGERQAPNTRERLLLTRAIGLLMIATLGLGAYVALDPRPRTLVTRTPAPEPVEAAVSMEPDDVELVPDASTSAGVDAAPPQSGPADPRPIAEAAPRAKRRAAASRGHGEPARTRAPEVAAIPRTDVVPIACVLEPNGPGCGRAAAPIREPATPTIQAPDPSLPETLSQSALRQGIAAVKASAKQCAGRHGGAAGETVKIRLSIVGSSGAVQSTTAEGEHRGTALGNCVAAALKKASFPRFRKPAIGLEYTITL